MWFFFALLAGLFFAANRLLVRSILTKKVNPMAFGAIHEFFAGLLLLPVGLYFFSFPHSFTTLMALALGIFSIFLCDLFAFLSLEKIEASLYQIIGQLRHIIVLFGAYLLFTEDISTIKIISIILIIAGVAVALVGKTRIEINKGTMYAFMSTMFIGIGFLFIKMATVDVSPTFAGSISLIVSGLLFYLLLRLRHKGRVRQFPIDLRKQLSFAIVTFAVFEFALFTALAIGEASRVTPVTQSSMIFTLVGGYLFLNEKQHLMQKIIGCLLILVGICLLYVL